MIPATAMAVSVLAARGAPDAGMTVGDLAFRISHAIGQRPADQATAVRTLTKAGVDLGKDVGVRLTWGRAARILQDLGLQVAPPNEPAGQISMARAAQIVNIVAMTHGDDRGGPGRHHGKGCPASPSDPDDCDHHDHDGDHDHGDNDDRGDDDHDGN